VPFVFLTCGRWAHYHTPQDTPDRLDYAKIAATARWLEVMVRDACARPEATVKFTGARDDASTLRSLVAVLAALEHSSEPAALAHRHARELLATCDEQGVSRAPAAIRQLVLQVEAALA